MKFIMFLKFLDTEKEMSTSKIVTVCHGDVWSNNMLFTEDEESVTLIDFQMLGRVHPALDLWYFLTVNSDKVSCKAGSTTKGGKTRHSISDLLEKNGPMKSKCVKGS